MCQGTIFLFFRRFSGELAFVYIHIPIPMKTIARITFTHHNTEFVNNSSYRLVTLAFQLSLNIPNGYCTHGRRQEKHHGEPITDWQVAPIHYYCVGTKRKFIPATAAYPRLVCLVTIRGVQSYAATKTKNLILNKKVPIICISNNWHFLLAL